MDSKIISKKNFLIIPSKKFIFLTSRLIKNKLRNKKKIVVTGGKSFIPIYKKINFVKLNLNQKYYLSDERWNVQGLDGNEPSRFDFGMNLGLQLYLTDYLGIIMRYNIIEEKEEESIQSMSINGLSFGIILK